MHHFAFPLNAKCIFMLVIENVRRVEVLSFAEESEHRNRTFEIMAIFDSKILAKVLPIFTYQKLHGHIHSKS